MRYLTIISLTLLLGACDNGLTTLKLTTKKVSNAISSTCTEAAKNVYNAQGQDAGEETTSEEIDSNWGMYMVIWQKAPIR